MWYALPCTIGSYPPLPAVSSAPPQPLPRLSKCFAINTCTSATKHATLSLLESTLTQKRQGGPSLVLPAIFDQFQRYLTISARDILPVPATRWLYVQPRAALKSAPRALPC